MRARYPDAQGTVERDGVEIFYEVYGTGEPTLLFVPPWSLVHSRVWKAQLPYLARHFRAVTFDPRGNGRSGRPTSVTAYSETEHARDALAVMDATGTEQAVLISLSRGAQRSLLLAAEHPERVLGAVFVGPRFTASWRGLPNHLVSAAVAGVLFERPPLSTRWLGKFNHVHWRRDLPDFARWWAERCFPEPHSTKQIEDLAEWTLETDADTLALATKAPLAAAPGRRAQRALAERVRCPVLVVHGTRDAISPPADGRALARFTGGELMRVEGGGHCTHARRPVPVNVRLREFVEQVAGRPRREPTVLVEGSASPPPGAPTALVEGLAGRQPRDPTVHSPNGRRRALYISSPIGLGHARRDLAIARELRSLVPDLEVDWLAQSPVTRMLETEGEHVHPASAELANESAHIESESAEHDLHCFQAWRRMDEILVANYMVFRDLVREQRYDLWIGDEAWELDYFLHEHPDEKLAPYAWLTDFVGWLPLAGGGAREAALTADYNAQMVEHVAAAPGVRDRALFVGEPEDCVPDRLGPQLPAIRDWTERNFEFPGYVSGFDPAELADRERLRAELGYRPGEQVCLVTVGGSGVGAALLRRVMEAYPAARELVPDLRMIVVAGPRIDPRSLPAADGLQVCAYVHDLYRHLAACDLAVVQGGLTTAMELTANKRPFLYFPLKHHFEQSFHVHHRLDRYGAGRRMDFDAATPDVIAAAIADEIGREVDYRDVDAGGARRAAERLAELL